MQGSKKKLEYVYFVLFVLLVSSFCFVLDSQLRRQPEQSARPWLQNSHPTNLYQVLRKASMGDRTVILTVVNETWARPNSILDLFLESFHIGIGTKRLLNHVIIVATDDLSYKYCNLVHHICFDLRTFGSSFSSTKHSMSDPVLLCGWRKIKLLREVIELGYHFIYTAADVMWLKNPFPELSLAYAITTTSKFYTGNSKDETNVKDEGLLYARSNEFSLEFFRYWDMARVLYPNSDEQYVFEIIKYDEFFKSIGLHFTYLDPTYFGRFCELSRDMNKVVTMQANCCDSTESKLHDIKLVLEDWRTFTAKFNGTTSEVGPTASLTWRAPSKCKP